MKWAIDLDSDAIYIYLTDAVPAHQVELRSGVVADLDAQGNLRGIEVLKASYGWDAEEILARYDLDPADADSLRYLANLPSMVKKVARAQRPSATTASMSDPRATTSTMTSGVLGQEGEVLTAA
jgi:uncharacterized protein YuzE